MNRLPQMILITSTVLGSWLGMQAVHESGHVLGAWLTGGKVSRVILHPLTISRTDFAENPRPLVVVWAGPTFGVIAPLVLWGIALVAFFPGAFVFTPRHSPMRPGSVLLLSRRRPRHGRRRRGGHDPLASARCVCRAPWWGRGSCSRDRVNSSRSWHRRR